MKKIISLALAAVLVLQMGTGSVWAQSTEEGSHSEEKYLELSYDDRYSFADGEEYSGYIIKEIVSTDITSRQVENGTVTSEYDTAVLTQVDGSETDVIATGVGTATVTLIKESASSGETPEGSEGDDGTADYAAEDDPADGEAPSDGNSEDGTPGDETPDDGTAEEDAITVAVTVSPAPLTLMYISGQSNAEGYCSSNTGNRPDQSVVCEEGEVYSTYAPSVSEWATYITGITFSHVCSSSNYSETAVDFVAGSLTGDTAVSGAELEYPLNSLTAGGLGKTGIDSGLAWEWNLLTGDKVWVVNAAWGGSSIAVWISDEMLYERAQTVYDLAYAAYCAEIEAGHYTAGKQLLFWLQGETDKDMDLDRYSAYFERMYADLTADFAYLDGIGVISVRSCLGSYTSLTELAMSSPRIVQYLAGLSTDYEKLFVVSNVNERWVTDEGVAAYFSDKYGSELSYPTGGDASVPEKISDVHSDIHYSQIAHNENGITAAEGMYHALWDDTEPAEVIWRNLDGNAIEKIYLITGQAGTAVPVASPVYTAKKVIISENGVTYDNVTGEVVGNSETDDASLTPMSLYGSVLPSPLSVSVSDEMDFTEAVGEGYTGFYYYQGKWYYLIDSKASSTMTGFAYGTVDAVDGWWYVTDGIVTLSDNTVIKDSAGAIGAADTWYYVVNSRVQSDYTGVADYANDNGWWYIRDGSVDFTYTGFSSNSYGSWYVRGGQVTLTDNTVLKDGAGAIGAANTWYYVEGSKVQYDYTGVANYANDSGWWYIRDGSVDFTYTGFSSNKHGGFYVEDGQVTFTQNNVLKDAAGAIGPENTWYYVTASQVQSGYTGIANYSNAYGWWYIRDGSVDFTYTGFSSNKHGSFYVEDGQVTFTKNSVLKDAAGAIGPKNTWYYVTASQVQSGYTGIANYSNAYGWWYIRDGSVDFAYTGFSSNKHGSFYVEGGQVKFTKNTVLKDAAGAIGPENTWYYVTASQVQSGYTGVANHGNAYGWWYIKNGKVDFSYTGFSANRYGVWYVRSGKVDFSYTGKVE